MKQFTRWLRLEKRNIDDPLVRLEMLNVQVDRRHDRRALSDEEVSKLLFATLNGKIAYRFEPMERMMLYIMALLHRASCFRTCFIDDGWAGFGLQSADGDSEGRLFQTPPTGHSSSSRGYSRTGS